MGIQQQLLLPSNRKTARKSARFKVYGECDGEQGDERALDGVGQREIGGERQSRECDGVREKGGESICEEIPEGDTLEIKPQRQMDRWSHAVVYFSGGLDAGWGGSDDHQKVKRKE